MVEKKKLSTKQRLVAIFKVAQLTFRAAPAHLFVQIIGALTDAILPIIVTYFVAATTTELAAAANGVAGAGEQAITYLIITAIMGIVTTAWYSVKQYLSKIMEYKIEAAVSDQMYEHFLQLEFWQYDDKKTIDNFDKAVHFASFFPYVFSRLSDVLRHFITLIAGLIALVFVSWWLGLILIVAVIPGIIIQFQLSRAQTQHWSDNIETRRAKNMIEWKLQRVESIAELRLYGVVRYLLNLRRKLRDKDDKVRIEFERKFIKKRLGADALEAGAETISLVWIVVQIIHQASPIGQFIYVQQIVSRTLSGATGLVSTINSLDEDLANLVYYQEFMDSPESPKPTKQLRGRPDSITVEHASFHYHGTKKNVLEDVSLTIARNQHVAIVGENGAGKTTLVKLITGLYHPTEGAVLLDGISLAEYDVSSWHKHLGVLQQDYVAYDFATAKENIQLGDTSVPFNQDHFDRALDMAEARTFLEKLPKGVDNFVDTWMESSDGTKGINLSGGQWQRLALARNLYRDSPIIILDEPTSAIDALAESHIFKHLFAKKDKTVITISHRLTTVKKADVIYMLKDGRVVESGTHDELVANKSFYYKMFKSQL